MLLTCKLKGELGNNLFQIATTIAESKGDYVLPTVRDCYVSNQERPLEISQMFSHKFPFEDINVESTLSHRDNDTSDGMNWAWSPILLSYEDTPVRLDGYYQSPRYFHHIRDELIQKFFRFKDDISTRMLEKYPHIHLSTALHVRRGGDRSSPNIMQSHGMVSLEYYRRAIDMILDLTGMERIMVFSDSPEWCASVFGDEPNTEIVRGNANYEDMYLMTQARNVIMANSTFSWWGAYLNQKNGVVVYPTNEWFGSSLRHLYTGDMFLKQWIGV